MVTGTRKLKNNIIATIL